MIEEGSFKVIKKFFWVILVVFVAIPMVTLSVTNKHIVPLKLDPTDPENTALILNFPFWYYIFAAIFFGMMVGSFVTWMGQGRWRKTARRRTREAHQLRAKSEQLSEQLKVAQREAMPKIPQLPQ